MRIPDANLELPHAHTYTQNIPVVVHKVPRVRGLHWGSDTQDTQKVSDLCSKEKGILSGNRKRKCWMRPQLSRNFLLELLRGLDHVGLALKQDMWCLQRL